MITIRVVLVKEKGKMDISGRAGNMAANGLKEKLKNKIGNISCEKHPNYINAITLKAVSGKPPTAQWTDYCCDDFMKTIDFRF